MITRCPICHMKCSDIYPKPCPEYDIKYGRNELLQHLLDHDKDDLVRYVYDDAEDPDLGYRD